MTKIIVKNASWEVVKELDGNLNETLLKQLEAEWIDIPAACFTGICGACNCKVEEGRDQVNDSFRWEPGFPMEDDEVMTCIAGLKEDASGEVVLKMMY